MSAMKKPKLGFAEIASKQFEESPASAKLVDNLPKVMPVDKLVVTAMDYRGMKNVDLYKQLDYPNPNVISMLRNGTMKLPPNKVGAFCRALGLDPLWVALCIDEEFDFGLKQMLKDVCQRSMVTTENEGRLLMAIREAANFNAINLEQDFPVEFAQILEILKGVGAKVAQQQKTAIEMEEDRRRKRAEKAAQAAAAKGNAPESPASE